MDLLLGLLFYIIVLCILFRGFFGFLDWLFNRSFWYIVSTPFLFLFGFICGLIGVNPLKNKPHYRYNHTTKRPEKIS